MTLQSIDLEVVSIADDLQPPSVPPPLPRLATRERALTPRTSHPEIGEAVFASLPDIAFFETAVEAASFALVTAMRALPSLAGLALLRDNENGGYVVVYGRGPRSYQVVRTRVSEDDPVVMAALLHGGPVAVEYGAERSPPARHACFGDPWTAFATPVHDGQRWVGLLELVDPLDRRTIGSTALHALTAISRQLADFIRGREVVVNNAFAPEQVGLEG